MGGAVFKTVERQSPSLVGSIPIRLRHLRFLFVRRLPAAAVVGLVDLRVPFACHNSACRDGEDTAFELGAGGAKAVSGGAFWFLHETERRLRAAG